ncbi:MAG: acyl-CoA dehydrogenase family protein [Anaerolineae bacterium]
MEMRMFGLSEDQIAVWRMCRDFVDEVVIPFVRENREREWLASPDERWPKELLQAADKLGLRALGVPEKYGGMELDALTLALVVEELARGDPGFAVTLAQNWKVSALLGGCAPQHMQELWFARYLEDPSFLMAHALTEPRGASDRWLPYNVPEANMHTRATFRDGCWVLNGRKQFISNGYLARLYIVYANTNPDAGVRDGTSSFLVPRDTPGFTVERANEKIGQNFVINAELVFEECRLPEDHLLVKDIALKKAGAYFRAGKILNAARALGVGRAAFEDTVAYVQEHVQGGRPLIQHQVVAARLADMATRLETVRVFTYHAARALDGGSSDSTQLGLMAKLYAAETVFDICRHAMELHGGSGAMREMGVEKHLRDASIFLHADGTSDIHRFKIVKTMFPDAAGAYAGPEPEIALFDRSRR